MVSTTADGVPYAVAVLDGVARVEVLAGVAELLLARARVLTEGLECPLGSADRLRALVDAHHLVVTVLVRVRWARCRPPSGSTVWVLSQPLLGSAGRLCRWAVRRQPSLGCRGRRVNRVAGGGLFGPGECRLQGRSAMLVLPGGLEQLCDLGRGELFGLDDAADLRPRERVGPGVAGWDGDRLGVGPDDREPATGGADEDLRRARCACRR
jgi:hypothetical protein